MVTAVEIKCRGDTKKGHMYPVNGDAASVKTILRPENGKVVVAEGPFGDVGTGVGMIES